jgi:hypothetical protein
MDIDKRILGFAGPTSSMHYITRMEEKLTTEAPKAAVRRSLPNPYASESPSATKTPRPRSPRAPRTSRSNNRPRQTNGAKTYPR